MPTSQAPLIVKVGGSLYDLPDLGSRLLAQCGSHANVILVPGGGPLVETIRDYDRRHHLGEEACHWLALRTLTINAHFLAQLLPHASIINDVMERRTGLSIVDGYRFARADEARPGHLPHSWAATSDSLAVRVAVLAEARELVLLKSVDVPVGTTWAEAASHGFVDEYFWRIVPPDLAIRVVNLRS